MDAHNEIDNIPLTALARDPLLPPRIVDVERLEVLCTSIRESGLAQPLVVRRAPEPIAGGVTHFVILGFRRFLSAGRLGWETARGIVRSDLSDQDVLKLAFQEDKCSEPRTPLEDAWYYASLCAGGMTQAAVACLKGVSEGKASMYVRVGNALTPERIANARVALEDMAGLGITKLAGIASGPEQEISQRIAAAVQRSPGPSKPEPMFEWHKGRRGVTRAVFRGLDPASWSSEERLKASDRLGPILAEARRLEGSEDPTLAALRSQLEHVHREQLLKAREARSDQFLRLMELNSQLLVSLNQQRAEHVSPPDVHRPRQGKVRGLLQSLRTHFASWRGRRLGSTIEGGASMVEGNQSLEDPQMRLRFDGREGRLRHS